MLRCCMLKKSHYRNLKPVLKSLGIDIHKPLYHATYITKLKNILTQGLNSKAGYGSANETNEICFSRSLDFYNVNNKSINWHWDKQDVIIILDERELSQRFKTRPFNYYYNKGEETYSNEGKRDFEYETRAWCARDITTIPAKYIKAILSQVPVKFETDIPIIYKKGDNYTLENIVEEPSISFYVERLRDLYRSKDIKAFKSFVQDYHVKEIPDLYNVLKNRLLISWLQNTKEYAPYIEILFGTLPEEALDYVFYPQDLEYVLAKSGASYEKAFARFYNTSSFEIIKYLIRRVKHISSEMANTIFKNTKDPYIMEMLKDYITPDVLKNVLEKNNVEGILFVAETFNLNKSKLQDLFKGVIVKNVQLIKYLELKGVTSFKIDPEYITDDYLLQLLRKNILPTNLTHCFNTKFYDRGIVLELVKHMRVTPKLFSNYNIPYGTNKEKFNRILLDIAEYSDVGYEDISFFIHDEEIPLDLFKAYYKPEYPSEIIKGYILDLRYDIVSYALSLYSDVNSIYQWYLKVLDKDPSMLELIKKHL